MTDEFKGFNFEAFVSFTRDHPMLEGHLEVLRNDTRSNSALRWVFDCNISVSGIERGIRCGIDWDFPASLPIFSLREQPADRLLPHVGPMGNICFQESEGLVIDWKNPNGIFDEALKKVHELLEEGFSDANDGEFLDEIVYYWENLSNKFTISSILDPSKRNARRITILTYTFESALTGRIQTQFAGETKRDLEVFIPPSNARLGTRENSHAWFIPLETYEGFKPPVWNSFWDAKALEEAIFPRISESTKSKLRLNKGDKLREVEHLILSLPLPNGSSAMLGIKIETKGFRKADENSNQYEFIHSIISPKKSSILSPIVIRRNDETYLIERGGGSINLKDKHVLLVGCGAVGSIAAMELAKAGIGKITLVDFDTLSVDNSHRHLLGFDAGCWSLPKVSLTKMEIDKHIRHVQVYEKNIQIENLILTPNFSVSDFSMVFLATGSPTTELQVNEWISRTPNSPPVVFAWVEALGIGGHALLSNNQAGAGCLKCLFTPHEDDDPDAFYNRASFAERDQFFAKTVAGCGTRFTPFSSLDATRTAIEAVRLAIDALTSEEVGHPIRSWKGNPKEFLRQGYKLSQRFDLSEAQLEAGKYDFRNPNCSVCGKPKQ